MEEIEEFTTRLVEELRLEAPEYDEEIGCYTLTVGELKIRCKDLRPGIYLGTYLQELPKEGRETLLMAVMHYNLFGMGTGGGVLGLEEESKRLTFSFAEPYRVTYREFRELIEDFANYVDYWNGELEKANTGKASVLTR